MRREVYDGARRGGTYGDEITAVRAGCHPAVLAVPRLGSGAELYARAPVLVSGGAHRVHEAKLVQRVAPGLIHELDALYAAFVVVALNGLGVRDVIAIHDAFLIPERAYMRVDLETVLEAAAQAWLPKLGPFYRVFERYLPRTSAEGKIARKWRTRWRQRLAKCRAGKDQWPRFRTKPEGAEFR